MAVQVAKRRVNLGFIAAFKGIFHDFYKQERVVIGRRDFTCGGVFVPQLPSLQIHQGFNVNGGDAKVTSVLFVQWGHGFSERHVQCRVVAHVEHGRVRSISGFCGMSGREGTDQVLLKFSAVTHHLEGLLDGIVARAKAGRPVVIRRYAIGNAPPGHGAVGIESVVAVKQAMACSWL